MDTKSIRAFAMPFASITATEATEDSEFLQSCGMLLQVVRQVIHRIIWQHLPCKHCTVETNQAGPYNSVWASGACLVLDNKQGWLMYPISGRIAVVDPYYYQYYYN